MNLFSSTAPQEFSLLSIGQRGVGKTVFLAGSYAELQASAQASHSQPLWFECQDAQAQENLEQILHFVAQSGQYPPATMKMTDFSFSLKQRTRLGEQTLCQFRWWDIPGEICRSENVEFQQIVADSHGSCVFIDGPALLQDADYLPDLEDIIAQVVAIATLVSLNDIPYAFALILTKCDLLDLPTASAQLRERLTPLTDRLQDLGVPFQIFDSVIPIDMVADTPTLQPQGAVAPLLWLVSTLHRDHRPAWQQVLSPLLPQPPNLSQSLAPGQVGRGAALSKRLRSWEARFHSLPVAARYGSLVGVATLGAIALLSPLWFNVSLRAPQASQSFTSTDPQALQQQIRLQEQALQRQPGNVKTLKQLIALHLQLEQFPQAIPFAEQLVQQQPQAVESRLQLAQLYEITGRGNQAEAAYDQVLTQQKNHLQALLGKATLRSALGDQTTARTLFAQAEQAAPRELKSQIRAVAQKTLSQN